MAETGIKKSQWNNYRIYTWEMETLNRFVMKHDEPTAETHLYVSQDICQYFDWEGQQRNLYVEAVYRNLSQVGIRRSVP